MTVTWDKKYSVGIKEIDGQHQRFVAAADRLDQAILAGEKPEEIALVFKELVDYVSYHFSTEEKYFDKFNFDGAEEHKSEHARFRETVVEMRQQYGEEGKLPVGLAGVVKNWLVNHVATMDLKYVECFHDHGLF